MAKTLKHLTLGILSLALFASCVGLLAFHFAQRKIASKMRAPDLQIQPEAASDLTYRTLAGEQRHLSFSKGHVVFLDLWGTWCIQCVVEMPTVQKLYDHYKDDPQVQFLIVSRLDSPRVVTAYAHRNHLSLPFYVTQDEEIPPSMQLNQYPATFIFAKDGLLVAQHTGAADWSAPSVISFLDRLKRGP